MTEKKVKERYGDSIFFGETPGVSNTVCFKDMTSDILNDKWYQDRKVNLEEERIKVIRAATNLIKMKFDVPSMKLIPISL